MAVASPSATDPVELKPQQRSAVPERLDYLGCATRARG
jgi:hypothetical protein